MRRKHPLVAEHYYHIFNRGVNRQKIFFTRRDWIFFLSQLRHYFSEDKVDILAYCLMPNHFHIVAFLKSDNFGVEVMRPFAISYTRTINETQRRVGPLFQGPFKNQLVDNERYLKYLTRYVHLNPVTDGLVANPEDWEFSSYRDYIGLRQGKLPVTDFVLRMFEPVNVTLDGQQPSQAARLAYAEFVSNEADTRIGLPARMMIDP